MEKHLKVSNADLGKWDLLRGLEKNTRDKIKFFKPHQNQLFAVLTDGRLIACGYNEYGWLGLGHDKNVETFEEITTLRGKKVKNIECGWRYTLVITEDGQVWGWGENENGQLGLGDEEDRLQPELILDKDIEEVKCCYSHSLALTKDGKVLAWGWNSDGQVGNGTKVYQLIPVQVKSLDHEVIVKIETGFCHSIAITTEGKVYRWGRNKENQLGIGNTTDQQSPVEINIQNQAIKSVVCSAYHTIFLAKYGELYMSGGNNKTPKLIENNSQNSFKQVYCIKKLSDAFCPIEFLYLAVSTSDKLFYFFSQDQDHVSELFESFLSLTDLVCRHYGFQCFPALLHYETSKPEKNTAVTERSTSSLASLPSNLGKLVQHLLDAFDSPEMSDIEFVFGENSSIKAHRIFLSWSSNYMKIQLDTRWSGVSEVSISEFSYQVYYDYVRYLYGQSLDMLNFEQSVELLTLSRKNNELGLKQTCLDLLFNQHLNLENSCRLYDIAFDLDETQLESKVEQLMRQDLKQLKVTQGYQQWKGDKAKRFFTKIL